MSHIPLKYAMIKCFYDCDSVSYVTALIPLILKAFSDKKKQTKVQIQDKINSDYDIKLPIDVIQSILAGVIRKGYFEYNSIEKNYTITKAGENCLDNFADESKIKREINSLFSDLNEYFSNRGYDLNVHEVESQLNQFISKNILDLSIFLNSNESAVNLNDSRLTDRDEIILEYIYHIENEKPQEYDTFSNVVHGSIITTALNSQDKGKIDDIITNSFENCTLYLDSNFIFSLLKLHNEVYTKPADELFQILKKFNFRILVFNFTVDEITRVLKGYNHYKDIYIPECKVDSVYYVLKSKGFTSSDVTKYISDIENKLGEIGIEIDNSDNINLNYYKPKDQNIAICLRRKNYNNLLGLNHDLAVIERIRKLREKPIRKLSECKYFFLSSDMGLAKINLLDMGHHANNTIPEVLKDSTFTNILWFKNPNIKMPLCTVLSFHSKELFINRKVWERFSDILIDLKGSKEIDDSDISLLVYDSTIQSQLEEMKDTEVKNLSKAFVFEKIEEAKREKIQQEEKSHKENKEKFQKQTKNKIETNIKNIKNKKKMQSNRYAEKITWAIRIVISLFIITIVYIAVTNEFYFYTLNKYGILIPICAILLMFLGVSFTNIWLNIQNKMCRKIYSQFLEGVTLDYSEELK